ncbi:hypothetical protein M1B78_17445 [Bacteroides sp. KH569_7]|uniref:Uncharacterized protein n=1 Tax=Bacteroides muris (ex Fokt et al. 2023) TaxID=2937417 RepID=A0A9X2P1K9_9BACE|nr:hypothetical protein [Bacteroides muris (ex Fokt et al. 2023)]MCR6509884.1 hypothetical protein [Bacteroides muris (ex Fokt et al. 2023)]
MYKPRERGRRHGLSRRTPARQSCLRNCRLRRSTAEAAAPFACRLGARTAGWRRALGAGADKRAGCLPDSAYPPAQYAPEATAILSAGCRSGNVICYQFSLANLIEPALAAISLRQVPAFIRCFKPSVCYHFTRSLSNPGMKSAIIRTRYQGDISGTTAITLPHRRHYSRNATACNRCNAST